MSKNEELIFPSVAFNNCDEIIRVLFVDDDTALHFAYSKMLEREGIDVDFCQSLQEAIKHIKSRPYHAVISDLRLAGTENTDGLDVMRVLQKEQPKARIILATGYSNSVIEQEARDLGVTHFFEKPVFPATLLEAIRSLILITD